MWVAFLKKRSEAFEKFKIFKDRVENESGVKIKCSRSDKEDSSPLESSTCFVKSMESKENYLHLEHLNRMRLLKEGISQ